METTLYYSLSTIAQVEAAIIAVLGVFIFYKQQRFTDLQIGQGKATLDSHREDLGNYYRKQEKGEKASKTENMAMRLQDAIHRKNLYGIEQIMILKTISELKENRTTRYGYYNHIYKLYKQTNEFMKRFSAFSIATIAISILSLVYSVISLSFVHEIIDTCSDRFILYSNLSVFLISILLSLFLVVYTFYSRLPFEKYKKESCDKLDDELSVEIENNKTINDEEESTATNT